MIIKIMQRLPIRFFRCELKLTRGFAQLLGALHHLQVLLPLVVLRQQVAHVVAVACAGIVNYGVVLGRVLPAD